MRKNSTPSPSLPPGFEPDDLAFLTPEERAHLDSLLTPSTASVMASIPPGVGSALCEAFFAWRDEDPGGRMHQHPRLDDLHLPEDVRDRLAEVVDKGLPWSGPDPYRQCPNCHGWVHH